MAIQFTEDIKQFHLFNEEISYIITVLPNGHLSNLYFGKRVSIDENYLDLIRGGQRSLTSYVSGYENQLSLQHVRQEYACYGTGDVSYPAFTIIQEDRSKLSDFKYVSHKIISGKPGIDTLPSVYANFEEEVCTLIITLNDSVSKTNIELYYSIFEEKPVITRRARFVQVGENSISIERALSFNLDLPDKDYDWLHLDGAWSRERHLSTSKLHMGTQSIYSLKGTSSAEHNPFIALKREDTNEHAGEVIGFSLLYSGNFLAQVDVTPFQQTRVSMGIHPETFSWTLNTNEAFDTPEVVIVYSNQGLNGMSHTFHSLINENIVRGEWKLKERPVLLNNWEATYFDFDEEKLTKLAEKAASVGVELFVLDDGWFGDRNDDHAGLGDWYVNKSKLPNGLQPFIQKVHQLGMKFGIWIEPEMVNKDSELYRQHPDWHFHHPARSESPSRHQFVLNLAHDEVFDNIYQQLYRLFSTHKIDYIKWDMNRYLTEVYSIFHTHQEQGEVYHRYILNLYRLYEKLISDFPHILFESCSSGGARFDMGMLYYAPQTWASDNTDAIERLSIQYGTSIVYPLSSMGSHVSAVPNHQVNRITSLETRKNVASFGNLGYELDLLTLSPEELTIVEHQIECYKEHREIFQYGQFTRIESPFNGEIVAWQVQSNDHEKVIVGVYRTLIHSNEGSKRIYLKNLDRNSKYLLGNKVYSGSRLMNVGIELDYLQFEDGLKDFTSKLVIISKI
ncbi:alpha-galactosidase [Streptococcus pasteurianus]|uniref:alpha-galactosidase n=1 Tax=Streptococcus pasteurianus TaxID=197614 RepID=UPI0020C025C1|nr:alpha-galactosidase [Streptococcus pasteurianus]WCQ69473.1 alpha-galactosidase [Streptococcus pasteurianus]WCQ69478.1 alpha-galactosidase [Streptococcus pasteurianus]